MAASASLRMTMSSLPLSLVLLMLSGADALQITAGSSCSSVCGDTSTTNSSDIVCSDFDYYSSGTGSTFMNCIECLKTSNATSGSDSDVSWFLYNLRYASAVCIYDFPAHNTSNSTSSLASCDLEYACAPLQGALEYGNLDPSNETEYGYCQADSSAFYGTSIDDCVSCLQSSPSTYTANFLLALEAGCQQEPQAGTLLSITGSLFSTTPINITAPSNSTSDTSKSSNKSALSLNDIIAIVCSLGGLFLLAMCLFILYCCRQRRYARQDEQLLDNKRSSSHQQQIYHGEDTGSGKGSISTVQTYAMPHYTVDYKSQVATAQHFGSSPAVAQQPTFPQGEDSFTSNADYYDRLEGRTRSQPLQAHPVRLNNLAPSVTSSSSEVDVIGHIPVDALPAHPAYIPRSTTPGHLGGRASRNVSRSASVRSSAPSQTQDQTQDRAPSRARGRQESAGQSQQQRHRRAPGKTDSYAIQVYLNGPEEPGASVMRAAERASRRDIQVELADPPETYTSPGRQLLYTPPVLSDRQGKSASPPPGYSGLAPPDRAATGTPAVSSLVLPSVPRIRVPGRKPPRLRIDDVAPAGGGSRSMRVSGPLAFPDSRFSVRPPNDRVVEHTLLDPIGPQTEVPIPSGKSYLYG